MLEMATPPTPQPVPRSPNPSHSSPDSRYPDSEQYENIDNVGPPSHHTILTSAHEQHQQQQQQQRFLPPHSSNYASLSQTTSPVPLVDPFYMFQNSNPYAPAAPTNPYNSLHQPHMAPIPPVNGVYNNIDRLANSMGGMNLGGASMNDSSKLVLEPNLIDENLNHHHQQSFLHNVRSNQRSPVLTASQVDSLNAIHQAPQPILKPTPPAEKPTLYKTELCKKWMTTGNCRYANKCQFAHGRQELRTLVRHPLYKTTFCKTFQATGSCRYGSRCRFIHDESQNELSAVPRLQPSAVQSVLSSANNLPTPPSPKVATSDHSAESLLSSSYNSVRFNEKISVKKVEKLGTLAQLGSLGDLKTAAGVRNLGFARAPSAPANLNQLGFDLSICDEVEDFEPIDGVDSVHDAGYHLSPGPQVKRPSALSNSYHHQPLPLARNRFDSEDLHLHQRPSLDRLDEGSLRHTAMRRNLTHHELGGLSMSGSSLGLGALDRLDNSNVSNLRRNGLHDFGKSLMPRNESAALNGSDRDSGRGFRVSGSYKNVSASMSNFPRNWSVQDGLDRVDGVVGLDGDDLFAAPVMSAEDLPVAGDTSLGPESPSNTQTEYFRNLGEHDVQNIS